MNIHTITSRGSEQPRHRFISFSYLVQNLRFQLILGSTRAARRTKLRVATTFSMSSNDYQPNFVPSMLKNSPPLVSRVALSMMSTSNFAATSIKSPGERSSIRLKRPDSSLTNVSWTTIMIHVSVQPSAAGFHYAKYLRASVNTTPGARGKATTYAQVRFQLKNISCETYLATRSQSGFSA